MSLKMIYVVAMFQNKIFGRGRDESGMGREHFPQVFFAFFVIVTIGKFHLPNSFCRKIDFSCVKRPHYYNTNAIFSEITIFLVKIPFEIPFHRFPERERKDATQLTQMSVQNVSHIKPGFCFLHVMVEMTSVINRKTLLTVK